ncbi:porin family protein [Cecembia sp.]|uniref:porin family protein n=1 Tax=Cecembia sp. TaxID=1898110 RepID=UPI0025B7F04A|nr:porin family protein [Cecembia sp.]
MKKPFLLLFGVLLVFSATNSYAQFGARGGLNVANFDGFSFNSRLGFHLGAFYEYELQPEWSIEPGIYFSQKGYKSSSGDIRENLGYIDIPILARYRFADMFNVFAGPQGSLLVSRNYTLNGNVSQTMEVLRGYDIAGVLGAGVDLPYDINLQISYDLGLVSLNYFDVNVKNRVFKFSVARRF